jgi:hypothetical protein
VLLCRNLIFLSIRSYVAHEMFGKQIFLLVRWRQGL